MYGGPFGREDKSTAPALAALGAVGKTIRWTSFGGGAYGSVQEELPKHQQNTLVYYISTEISTQKKGEQMNHISIVTVILSLL